MCGHKIVNPLDYIICADKDAYCCNAFIPFWAAPPDPTRLQVSRDDLDRRESYLISMKAGIDWGVGYMCVLAFRKGWDK